jgi:HPt (histidine-containing phosphotransfer) domain-containing protein
VAQGIEETVEMTAHTLKGELGYMGLPEISQKAGELEKMGVAIILGGRKSSFTMRS